MRQRVRVHIRYLLRLSSNTRKHFFSTRRVSLADVHKEGRASSSFDVGAVEVVWYSVLLALSRTITMGTVSSFIFRRATED